MSLSESIPALKSKAKKLHRAEHIPLHEALDRVAAAEGYASWSLLASRAGASKADLLDRLAPGELVLLAARPRQGKTLCALKLLISSLRRHRQGWFFSLENDAPDIDALFGLLGEQRSTYDGALVFEHSDELCAQTIIERASDAAKNVVVVVDYLQLLDQRRSAPALQQQVTELSAFAKRSGCIVV